MIPGAFPGQRGPETGGLPGQGGGGKDPQKSQDNEAKKAENEGIKVVMIVVNYVQCFFQKRYLIFDLK